MANSLLSAVDNHNIANGDPSWFQGKVDATTGLVEDIGRAARYGLPGAVVSGVNSIINSGIAVANFVGAGIEEVNTYDTLKKLDDNLAGYYEENKSGVDTAGFVLGSIGTGLGGLGALKMVKAGYLGANTAKAAGLMTSLQKEYSTAAKIEFASGSPYTLLNANVIKSLAAGTGEAVVEMAAMETMVAATMFKAPTLEQQTLSDGLWTIAENSLIFGGIGGVLKGIGITAGIKGAKLALEPETFPYRLIPEAHPGANPELQIINYARAKFEMPEPALLAGVKSELSEAERLTIVTRERTKTLETLDRLMLEQFQKLSGGDEAIAIQMNNKFKSATKWDEVRDALLDIRSTTRVSAAENLKVGDVKFPQHGLDRKIFNDISAAGRWEELFTDVATKNTEGYRVVGNLSKLAVADGRSFSGTAETAFANGYDVFRNPNGTFSVNPGSEILQRSDIRRLPETLVVDFEKAGAIVDKATPGLADLATKAKPIQVNGTTVLAGELNPIRISAVGKFDPTAGSYLDAQAHYIWAQEQSLLHMPKVIGENDLHLLERIYYAGEEANGFKFSIRTADGTVSNAPRGEVLAQYITDRRFQLLAGMADKPIEEIALRLNTSEKWLQGQSDELAKLRPGINYQLPRYAKVSYDPGIMASERLNANNIEGMLNYQRQVELVRNNHKQTTAAYMGEFYGLFLDDMNWADSGRMPTSRGAGATFLGAANANPGSAGSWAQSQGVITDRLTTSKVTSMLETFNPVASSVKMKPEAEAELLAITNRLRAEPMGWTWHPKVEGVLIPVKELNLVKDKFDEFGKITRVGAEPTQSIKITSPELIDFGKTHMKLSYGRQIHIDNMKGAAGLLSDVDHAVPVWYPPPIDTVRYKHFVFVEPREMTVGDKKRVIVAKDEATLNSLIKQVDQNQFRVYTKVDSEDMHRALGDYQFALGMNESMVDSSMARKGILSDFFGAGSGEPILETYLNWQVSQEERLARSMVFHRFAQNFEELKHLGRAHTNLATSQFRSLTEALEKNVQDPYYDVVKTALNISRASEYPAWTNFNDIVRRTIEAPGNKFRELWASTQNVDDTFVAKVNQISRDYGVGFPIKNAADYMISKGNIADKPFLGRYISQAQSIMSTTLLQLDSFNALNNIISTPILGSAEMKFLMQGIEKADPTKAGMLKNLMSVTLPDGSSAQLPSIGRLTTNAIGMIHGEGGDELLKYFQRIGANVDIIQQERMMVKHLALDFANVSANQAQSAIEKAVEFGRKWTGNTLAETYSRAVPAAMAKQITDVAVSTGVITEKAAAEFILNYVNKVQGNYLYSQRPIVFQGVVGQAISLFQTYQFNLMQQLFKYVENGDKKSMGMLLGLQGSIYGMQGLPAFNFLNTHIVGNAAGNTEHKDLYAASQTTFGRELGSWLMYGAGSNALGVIDPSMKVNIYSRGDINPRQVTVLPTNIADIPVVNASVKFVKNLLQVGEKLGNGADGVATLTQALEHNGLSRPLAGLAQVIQGYTTTNQSSLLSKAQDFGNIATISRIAGGKPFDEAVALDALYRINAYKAKDGVKIQELGAAMKTSLAAGKEITGDQVETFAGKYVRAGGKIDNFNRFMTNAMIHSNESQVNALAKNLNSPYAQQLQIIMGGKPLPDFMNGE